MFEMEVNFRTVEAREDGVGLFEEEVKEVASEGRVSWEGRLWIQWDLSVIYWSWRLWSRDGRDVR